MSTRGRTSHANSMPSLTFPYCVPVWMIILCVCHVGLAWGMPRGDRPRARRRARLGQRHLVAISMVHTRGWPAGTCATLHGRGSNSACCRQTQTLTHPRHISMVSLMTPGETPGVVISNRPWTFPVRTNMAEGLGGGGGVLSKEGGGGGGGPGENSQRPSCVNRLKVQIIVSHQ